MRLGVLTGGGDCPGLNAVLRAIARRVDTQGHTAIGFNDAWQGVRDNRWRVLDTAYTRGIMPKGGTVLGTSRGGPFDTVGSPEMVQERFDAHGLDALVVVGGNGTLTVADRLYREHGLPTIGVPKTIDNDVLGTDTTFGFATAVQTACDAIDRLHSTAESHDRILVAEVMGRDTGWIAAYAGIGGGAAATLVPEHPYSVRRITEALAARHSSGRLSSVVVVAEGARPEGGVAAPGVGERVAAELHEATGFECRFVVLGHMQRGGTPVAADRVLATRMGTAAVDFAAEGHFGQMTALRGTDITPVSMAECSGRTRHLDLASVAHIATTTWG